ncbi:MAG: hypothetical protein J6K18_00115 [Bacilli bacterium]|nr:hypothetical protein [Bacilli bacterium]
MFFTVNILNIIADRIRSYIQPSTEGLIEINTINIDDKFELVTHGGLPQELSADEFFKARSLPRNRDLMKIMNDLDMGEHIGRGMRRIMQYLKKRRF